MNSFLETLKQLGPARLGIMFGILMALILFFVFISVRVSSPRMELLYADLSQADSAQIATKLQENGIAYEISLDGGRITAPSNEIGKARMLLAAEGLPNGGSLGYELFDEQSGFGTTNFVQNVNMVRALEGELARTISSLENIRSARVHVVLPQRELFSREQREASASVFLGIRPGKNLSREQILSIQSLVSSAVPELETDSVSVIDSDGNLLAKAEDENSLGYMSLKAEELRRNTEERLASKIEDQVSRIVGYGNVRAMVTAEINFDRINTSEELYDPASQVVRSAQTIEESSNEREPPPDNVSVQNNLPGLNTTVDAAGASAQSNRLEEVTNFEISRTVRNIVREAGEISNLSVAVLVDGHYEDNEEGEKTYIPRTEQELSQIAALVRSAVGIDEERGDSIEVVNLQFADVQISDDALEDSMLFGFEKGQILKLAELLIVTVMILLIALLVLQPMINRLIESEIEDTEEALEQQLLAATPSSPALAPPSEEGSVEIPEGEEEDDLVSIQGVDGKVKASTIKKVEEIVQNHPVETVAVIRSWMSSEN